MTPEEIFIKEFECPSNCDYNVGTVIPNQKGTKQGYVCSCICMKAFVAGYNKSIELKTKKKEMNNVVECICRLLPNKVYITVPNLQKGMLYVITGISELYTNEPLIIVKKNEEGAKATYNVPYRLVGEIIVRDF